MHLHLIDPSKQLLQLLCVSVEIFHLLSTAHHVLVNVLQLALELLHAKHHTLDTVVQHLFLRVVCVCGIKICGRGVL